MAGYRDRLLPPPAFSSSAPSSSARSRQHGRDDQTDDHPGGHRSNRLDGAYLAKVAVGP